MVVVVVVVVVAVAAAAVVVVVVVVFAGGDSLSYPITGLERVLGFQEVEAPRISRQ
jgi:ABC-type microcin C transport system permease subunit YejB